MLSGGAPESTVDLRCYHVARVGREVGGTPATLDAETLTRWMAGRSEWSPNTRRAYRGSLRAFYKWAVAAKSSGVTYSPAHELPPVKAKAGRPKPTPEAGYKWALRIADKRVGLAIRMGGTLGMRRGEIAKARREDLVEDLAGWSLRVVGKGDKERFIPVPDSLAAAILARPPGYLFPSSHGGHLTPHHLGKLISRELPEGYTTHSLRHRAGTRSYRAKKDIRATQELLGHAKLDTTMIYVEPELSSIRDWMEEDMSA